MAAKKQKIIEIRQHHGGGWDIHERGKLTVLAHLDREIDAERKARDMVKHAAEAEILVIGESGRIYRHYRLTTEDQTGKTGSRKEGNTSGIRHRGN